MVGELADSGVLDLAVSGGEPLLRADLFRILEHAVRLGFAVGVGTNGTTINPGVASRLFDLGINRLQVSVDGFPSSHDKLRCWPGLYRRALRAIEIARSAGLNVHICCTITQINFRELEGFVDFVATEIGVCRLNLSRYVPVGRGSDDLDLTNVQWQEVILRCAQMRKKYKTKLDIVTHLAQTVLADDDVIPLPGFIGCQAGRGQGCVTADGVIFPCVLLPVPVGNIREASFRSLWSSSAIIRALQDREYLRGACGGCAWRERCGGCRAIAFTKTGDCFSSDPRCWLSV